MSDYIDRRVGEHWFIFGEHCTGNVDLSDGTNDVFENITRADAEELIAVRDAFLRDVRAIWTRIREKA